MRITLWWKDYTATANDYCDDNEYKEEEDGEVIGDVDDDEIEDVWTDSSDVPLQCKVYSSGGCFVSSGGPWPPHCTELTTRVVLQYTLL